MKRIKFMLITIVILSNNVFGQTYTTNDFIGTWEYENNDTIFTVILKKGKYINDYYNNITSKETYIFGGYSLSVNGEIIDDYTSVNDTFNGELEYNYPLQHIYIKAIKKYGCTNKFGFKFYDQRKKHFDSKGISGGNLTLLAPNKLKWEIDEEAGIWNEIEGCEDCPEVKPIGFSVPNGVIMTKVQ